MNRTQFIKGTSQLLIAEGLLIPTGFVTAVYLARELAPANYGLFAMISMLVIWVENLFVSALQSTTIKFISAQENKNSLINTTYVIYAALGSVVALLIICITPSLCLLVKSPEIKPLLNLLCLDIPLFSIAHASRHIANGSGQYHQDALLRSTYVIARLIFILFFVELGLSIRGAILGLISASALEAILGLFLIKPNFIHGGFKKFNQFWQYLAPLQLAELNKRLLTQELIVLKALGGTATMTGCYGAAKNLAIIPILLSRAVSPTLLSTLTQNRQKGNEQEAKKIATYSLRLFFWFLPLTVLLASSSEKLILFIFGAPYIDTISLFSIILFTSTGFLGINIGGVIFTAWNKPEINVWTTSPLVPIVIIGIWTTYRYYGATSIAYATLFAVIASILLTWILLYKILRLWAPLFTMIKSLIISLMILGIYQIWSISGWMIIIKISTLTLLIGLAFWLLQEFSLEERQFISRLWNKCINHPKK